MLGKPKVTTDKGVTTYEYDIDIPYRQSLVLKLTATPTSFFKKILYFLGLRRVPDVAADIESMTYDGKIPYISYLDMRINDTFSGREFRAIGAVFKGKGMIRILIGKEEGKPSLKWNIHLSTLEN